MERRKSGWCKILEAQLGVTAYTIPEDVRIKLKSLEEKIEADLYQGFTYCELHGLSYSAVYLKGSSDKRFMVAKTRINGQIVRNSIWGEYLSSLGKVTILIGNPLDDSILDCRVYLNGNTIAGGSSKYNPFGICLKMLDEYQLSSVDISKTNFIFKKMSVTGSPFWNSIIN